MQRRLNWRLAVILVIAAVLVTSGIYGLHVLQVGRSQDLFLRTAQEAEEAGDYVKAVESYRLYLRLQPRDTAVRAQLGRLFAEIGQASDAFNELEQTLRLDPGDEEIRREIVPIAMQIGRFTDAETHLRLLLDARKGTEPQVEGKSEDDAELFDWLGQCQAASVELEDAAKSFVAAIGLDPTSYETYGRLAALLRHRWDRPLDAEEFRAVTDDQAEGDLTRLEQADRIMEVLVEQFPDAGLAHQERGLYLARAAAAEKDPAQSASLDAAAAVEAETAARLEPDDINVRSLAAQCALQQGNLDQARAHAEHGVSLKPRLPIWYRFLAEQASRSGNTDEAISWLRQGVDRSERGQDELLVLLANALLALERTDEAVEAIEDLRSFDNARHFVRYLDARVALAQGNWAAAAKGLESVRPDFRERPRLQSQIDVMLGTCYRELGDRDKHLAAIRRVSDTNPEFLRARLELAQALVASNQTDEAYRELVEIANAELVDGTSLPASVFLDLTKLAIRRNLRLSSPDTNWAEAEKWLAIAARKSPQAVLIPIMEAEIAVGKGDADRAEQILSNAKQERPEQLSFWIGLANLVGWKSDWSSARAILDEASQVNGDAVVLRLAKARVLYHQSEGTPATDELLELAAPNDEFTPEQNAQLWRELARYAIQMRELDLATELLNKLTEQEPDELDDWVLRFELAVHQDDSHGVKTALAAVERIAGRGPRWHYGQAVHLHMHATDEDTETLTTSLEHLQSAQQVFPGPAALLAAQIHQRMGQPEQAVEKFIEAIEHGSGDAATVRQAVQLLSLRQRFREADSLIREFERRQSKFSPEVTELGRVARQVSMQLEDFDRALTIATRTAEDSANYQDHLWLGQLATARGFLPNGHDPALVEQAEQAFRRAVELGENVPEPWISLVVLLGRLNRTDEAEQLMREAAEKVPTDQLPTTLAQCYEGLGRFEEAEAKFLEAVAASPANSNVLRTTASFYLRMRRQLSDLGRDYGKEAERYLAGILEDVPAENADTQWARNQLALLEFGRGGRENIERADKLLLENLSAKPDSLPDRRLRALVLIAKGSAADRAEAFEILQGVGDQATPFENFAMAQLLERRGDWAEAARRARQVIDETAGQPEQLRYIGWYAAALIRHDQLSDAEAWITQLEQVEQGRELAISLQAEILARRGSDEQARQKLLELVLAQDANSGDDNDKLAHDQLKRRVASRLETLAQFRKDAPAEAQKYRQAAEQLLDALALAAYQASQGNHEEAISRAEAAADDAEPRELLPVLVAVIESQSASEQHLERVNQILSRLLRDQSEQPSQFLMAQARLYSVQRQFAKAEANYRRVIELEPRSYIALNNLAMLLVGQNKQLRDAHDYIERAIEIVGPMPQLLDSQALVVLAQGHPKHAVLLLEQALTDVQAAEFFFHLAAAHHRLGRVDDAKLAMARANEIGLNVDHLTDYELQMHGELVELMN